MTLANFQKQLDEWMSSFSSDSENASQLRKKMPRTEAIKKLWAYIKAKKSVAKKMSEK